MYSEMYDSHRPKNQSSLSWFCFGALAGAAVMYLFDPNQGGRRRALARDKAVKLRNNASALVNEEIPRRIDYVSGFAEGARHRALETIQGTEHPAENDQMLIDRVMSTVFRDPDMPKGDVNVDAASGIVYLRGHMADSNRVADLESRVRKVDGVRDVVNLINRPHMDPTAVTQEHSTS